LGNSRVRVERREPRVFRGAKMSTDGVRTDYEGEDPSLADAAVTFIRRDRAELCVLEVGGDLDIAISVALGRALDDLLDVRDERVSVDLSGVTFMDSSALSVLVSAHERARENGQQLELLRPSPACAKVLSITGLDRVFDLR
jgi:anti-sigma B factor antagonist